MKNLFRFFVSLTLLLVMSGLVLADVAFPTQTKVYFKKDGEPVSGQVDYKVTCYGYTSYPGEDDFLEEKAAGSYTPENVYEYEASCKEYGCKIYEPYYLNYREIDYCTLSGTYDGQKFEIENYASTPIPQQCEDLHQYDESSGDQYYRWTDEYETCLNESNYDFDKCDNLKEEIPNSEILFDDSGSVLERTCEATFEIPKEVVGKGMFVDVLYSHANYDAVHYVKVQGIVNGYPDGTYQPDKTINRAEFLKILIEATYNDAEIEECLVEPKEANATYVSFKDVPIAEWFAKYVCVAKKNAVVNGYADGTFKPNKEINFAEAMKIIVNTFKYAVSDVPGEWYVPFVKAIEDKYAIPSTIYSYDHKLTRGEMAEIIFRLKANVANKSSVKPTEDWKLYNQPKIILQAK